MQKIIEYFDRSYVINLSDRVDRRRQVEREFLRIGIEIPNEKVFFYNASRPLDKGQFTDIGTRGCFTSHRDVLDCADRDRLRNVLVFEDDVSFRNLGTRFEERLLGQLCREDWDLLFFGYLSPSDEGLVGPLTQWSGGILGTHFYAVNGRFIGAMLQYMKECESRPLNHPEGGPMPADGAFNHVREVNPNIKLLLSVPSLAYQRSSRSDIAELPGIDKRIWLQPIVRSARTIKDFLRSLNDTRKLRRQLRK